MQKSHMPTLTKRKVRLLLHNKNMQKFDALDEFQNYVKISGKFTKLS
jgi:hypothetical protein